MDVLDSEKPKIKKAPNIKGTPKPSASKRRAEEPTLAEYRYASDLNYQYQLNLTQDFLHHRNGVRQLIRCFGFHKNSENAHETGRNRIKQLRDHYCLYSSDPGWLADKLNTRIHGLDDCLSKEDLEFMIELLNGSEEPLEVESLNSHPECADPDLIDPEDVYFQKNL